MRHVLLTVGNKEIGRARTWAYPEGYDKGEYWIPTYQLTAQGNDESGSAVEEKFEVLRFGLYAPTRKSAPKCVGLANDQTYVIKAWLPHYTVHSAESLEIGAWQVYGNFLIHDGPDDPETECYASIGCVEICGSPQGFDGFNDLMIRLSGAKAGDRAARLAAIGKARNITIKYLKARRPSVTKAK